MTKYNPKNIEVTELKFSSAIPDWVSGKLIRNGPAMFHLKDTELLHWFDGYGMLQGILFENGKSYYHAKYIESQEYREAMETGKVKTLMWGTPTDPCASIFSRLFANFISKPSNTNVNVIQIGQKFFSTSDIATMTEFDLDTLDTREVRMPNKNAVMAAHPSYTSDNKVWNMLSEFGPVSRNTFVSFDSDFKPEEQISFTTRKTYYAHSFANTDRYLVSIEQPMKLDFGKLITSGIQNRSFYECYTWNAKEKNILHIFDRHTKKLVHIPTEYAFFFFHVINTFEREDRLIIDIAGYSDNSIINDFYIDKLSSAGIPDAHKASIRRLEINLTTNTVELEDFAINLELPTMNEKYRQRAYRYAYGIHSAIGQTQLATHIVKFDFETGVHTLWGQDGMTTAEPIFIPNPEGLDEDDGILVTLCSGSKDEESKTLIVIIDARTMRTVSSADLPQYTPPGLHGWFYPVQK